MCYRNIYAFLSTLATYNINLFHRLIFYNHEYTKKEKWMHFNVDDRSTKNNAKINKKRVINMK